MSKELVSIIVPIYKVEKYLRECIDSIVNQTYKDLEIILVDDGSPDNCGKICDEYAEKDDRIKVIHKENGGLSSARNAGLDIATGEYIAFIDSDDVIATIFIEILLNVANEYNVDIVKCTHTASKKNFIYNKTIDNSNIEIFDKNEAIDRLYSNKFGEYVITCNKIYKRYLFDEIRFPDGKINEDCYITYKLFWYCKSNIANVHKNLYCYRVREDSIMHQEFSTKRYDVIDAYDEAIEFFKQNDKSKLDYVTREKQVVIKDCYYKTFYGNIDNKNKELEKLIKRSRKNYKNLISNSRVSRKEKIKFTLFNIAPKGYYIGIDILRNVKILLYTIIFTLNYFIYKILNFKKQEYIFVGNPEYGNIGDQAIALSTEKFEKDIGIKSLKIKDKVFSKEKFFKNISMIVSKKAIICIYGGGFIGSLWIWGEKGTQNVIKYFNKNKIVVFPQTVYYDEDNLGNLYMEEDKKIFNSHNDLNLFWREKESFNLAKKIFNRNNNYLCPDMVLYLDTFKFDEKREDASNKKVLLCFRNDLEKINDIAIEKILNQNNYTYDYTDTVINGRIKDKVRSKIVLNKIKQFSQYDLVITDRLHGMILTMLAGTPTIALDNISHKIRAVYETWLKDNKAISFVNEVSEDNLKSMINIEKNDFSINKMLYSDLEKVLTHK